MRYNLPVISPGDLVCVHAQATMKRPRDVYVGIVLRTCRLSQGYHKQGWAGSPGYIVLISSGRQVVPVEVSTQDVFKHGDFDQVMSNLTLIDQWIERGCPNLAAITDQLSK